MGFRHGERGTRTARSSERRRLDRHPLADDVPVIPGSVHEPRRPGGQASKCLNSRHLSTPLLLLRGLRRRRPRPATRTGIRHAGSAATATNLEAIQRKVA